MDTDFYDEDLLPEDQQPIKTSNVERVITAMTILTHPEKRYATMGIVTAPSGCGKSIATLFGQKTIESRYQRVLPATIRVKLEPRSTTVAFTDTILDALGEKSKGRTIDARAKDAAKGLRRNDLRLIILDEGDRLKEDNFEVVRYLLDRAGCPFLIVGLPHIYSVIDRQEKFAGRVSLRVDLDPLELDEVLNLVLPGLVFPRWSFDPHNEADRLMGAEIWKMVCPSLRKLRNLLELAGITAGARHAPAIALPHIEEAFGWLASSEDKRRQNKRKPGGTSQQGTPEQRSEERHKGKDRDKRGK